MGDEDDKNERSKEYGNSLASLGKKIEVEIKN